MWGRFLRHDVGGGLVFQPGRQILLLLLLEVLLLRAQDRMQECGQAKTFELVHIGLLRFQPTPMRIAPLLSVTKKLLGFPQHGLQFPLRPKSLLRTDEPCIDLVEHRLPPGLRTPAFRSSGHLTSGLVPRSSVYIWLACLSRSPGRCQPTSLAAIPRGDRLSDAAHFGKTRSCQEVIP